MDANTFFNAIIPAFLAGRPEALPLDAVYLFRIQGEGGGVWTLDLKSAPPACQPGQTTPSACAIEMSHADFELILSDPGQSRDLFYRNRIKVEGSLMLASQLPKIFAVLGGERPPEGLAALLAPLPAQRFLDEHWPNEALTVHGGAGQLETLAGLPELRDVHALLDRWPGMVRRTGSQGASLVNAADARRAYQQGHALVFDHVEEFLPALRPWLAKLQWDLCLPANVLGRCIVYASPRGTGAPLHFDQNANFVFQLAGEKRWQIAPNRHVINPLVQFLAGSPDVPDALKPYCEGPMPVSLPNDAQTADLRPGSVLFLPRAWWHATRALEDSLQLNFTFDQPAWVDVILPAIYRELIRNERWRELAHGAGAGSGAARQAAVARLDELIRSLAADLSRLDAASAIAELRPSKSAAYATE
jgi:50S ribosomal protein L16 3-hydroxylase